MKMLVTITYRDPKNRIRTVVYEADLLDSMCHGIHLTPDLKKGATDHIAWAEVISVTIVPTPRGR